MPEPRDQHISIRTTRTEKTIYEAAARKLDEHPSWFYRRALRDASLRVLQGEDRGASPLHLAVDR